MQNYIKADGTVTRPQKGASDETVTLTATLTAENGTEKQVTFDVKVLAVGVADNLMYGGYGWNNGWATTSNAVDGKMGTAYDIGSHSLQVDGYQGVVKTGSGEVETYNKIVCYVKNPQFFNGYEITGYTVVPQDPGSEIKLKPDFTGAEGKTVLVTKEQTSAMETMKDKDKMVWGFAEAKQSKYFDINIYNQQFPGVGVGFYEFEVYYAKPADVSWDNDEAVINKPTAADSYKTALPAYSVYDQFGDKMGENLLQAFPGTLALKENYSGVTIEGGQLKIMPECTANKIELTYTAVDADRNTVLEKTLSIKIVDEISETIAYLEGQIPAEAKTILTLPTSYTFEGKTVSISWASSNTNYIAVDGTVTRPSFETGDQDVTLTATITPSGSGTPQTKEFVVKVIKLPSAQGGPTQEMFDEDAASLTLAVITNEIPRAVTKKLSLPTTLANGTSVVWTSANAAIEADGTVTAGDADVRGTLTAALSLGSFTGTKTFDLTVLPAGLGDQYQYLDRDTYHTQEEVDVLTVYPADASGAKTLAANDAGNVRLKHSKKAPPLEITKWFVTNDPAHPYAAAGNVTVSFDAMYDSTTAPLLQAEILDSGGNVITNVTIDSGTMEATISYNDGSSDTTAVVPNIYPGQSNWFRMTYEMDTETGLLRIFKDTELLASGYVKNNAKSVSALKLTLGTTAEAAGAIRVSNVELKTSKTNEDDVNAAAVWLEEEVPSETVTDLMLPVRYDEGNHSVRIVWTSNNTDYIASDGKVTRPHSSAGDQTVTLTAAIQCGTATIQKNIDVQVKAKTANPIVDTVEEAGAALTWDVISTGQQQTAVGKALALPRTQGGALVIDGKSYEGVNISWSSSNPAVLSEKGNVTRQAEATSLTLTATLSVSTGGKDYTLDVPFNITVAAAGKAVVTKNIMLGSYGWCTGGWGVPSNAVDGKMNTAWSLGNHTGDQGSMPAGLKTASGNREKYNKIAICFHTMEHLSGYEVMGYDTCASDPGKAASLAFAGGGGATFVASYDAADPATHWDENGNMSVALKTTKQSRYFGVTLNWVRDANGTTAGINEFEVYYVTPNEARWNDENAKVYKPRGEGETIEFELPEYTVYDEFGDEIVDESFVGSWALAEDYLGVTFKDGKVSLASGCSAEEIDLVYTAKDADQIWLQQTMTLPVETATDDYYTMMGVVDYLDTQILPQAKNNLNMLTSKDGVSIVWTSDDEEHIALDGTVTRPAYGTADKTVTLTASLSIGAYKFKKTYRVEVIQNATDEQIAVMDANRIDLGVKGVVSSNITLPTVGYYGSSISWTSNKANIISAEGVYTRTNGSGDSTPVILTATVTYNGKTVQKEITLYVATNPVSGGGTGNTGGGHGPGGGRGSSNGNGISGVDTPNIAPPPLTNEQLEQGVFADVPSGHWAKSYIEELAGRKIISGVDSSHYEPEREITREEFLKLIITAFGVTLKPDNIAFSDVVSGEWYADYVATAYKEGLVNGMTETEFGIGRSITRQDAVVILERVLTKLGTEYTGAGKEYTDSSNIADYAAKAVENLSAIGIVQGDEEGNFLPQNHTTRAEAAKIICAAMKQGGLW